MEKFSLNDCVESLVSRKRGIIQATYPDGQCLMFTGKGYEHLYPNQMKHVLAKDVPFNVDHHRVHTIVE